MRELPELTSRQREAAVERAGESLALTSGAGCGKTLVLARRFTELIMQAGAGEGQSPFDRFVALTFTDKAAAEMISRVRAVLLEALESSSDPADRRKLAEWITELPAAHISTIHSFCASLLRRHAVEAAVDPGFAVCADELLVGQLQTQSVEDAVLKAVERDDPDVMELLARAEMDRVLDDVKTLLARRIDWQEQDYSDPQETLARWSRWQELSRRAELAYLADDKKIRDELNYLAAYPCGEPTDKLLAYREEKLDVITRLLQHPESVSLDDVSVLKEKPGTVGGYKAWGGKDALVAYRRRLKSFVEKFAGLSLYFQPMGDADADAAGCLAVLTKLARLADDLYARQKRAAGLLDFDDLIDLTARMLRENPRVRNALRSGLDQLLIDECQDTDAHQLRMLWSLLADDENPPGGKVVIIGDLKQSIYRFRGAQAEAFRRLCGRFGKARILLNESFRAHRAGVSFVNEVFARLMEDYEPIVSSRRELPAGPSVEILLAECDEGADADAAAAAQAELVAQRVGEMIGREERVFDRETQQWRPVRAGDVAILFARMTTSLQYEHALQQRGLPYYVVGGLGFFRQQEVYDCLNALRVIDNPFDDVALFGLLRSAVFGLDDNVLLKIALAARPPYFEKLSAAGVLEGLTEPQRKQLCFARDLLAGLHRVKDALGPAALLERLLEQTGYAAVLLSRFHPAGRGGRRKLANVLRLLDAARTTQATGRITLADFIRRYDEFVVSESRYEQAAVVGESDDVIRIMTIHKAKGLEFPVVIIPDLNAGSRGPTGRVLFNPDWALTHRPPGLTDEDDHQEEKKAKDEGPISFRLAKEAEKKALCAEDVRKLYVAATRHQDHLIFVGADRRTKEGRFRESGSYLAMLDDCMGIAEALDAGREEIRYGEGFSARLARVKPSGPSRRRRTRPIGLRIVADGADAEKVADALAEAAQASEPFAPPLVGPLVGLASAGPISVTALVDFDHCPMLYRWRHELRTPRGAGRPSGPRRVSPVGSTDVSLVNVRLDAATAGTLFHRCMELVDFDGAASVGAEALMTQAGTLVARAAGEMELTVPIAPLVEELAGMLARLAEGSLMRQLTEARQRLAELAFVYRAGEIDITGQIDLLYQDAEGAWRIVDYKSDRIAPEQAEAHAKRYELQMLVYLAAARRHLGPAVADATVYFLRTGAAHRFAVAPDAFAGLEKRLADLAAELTRCRQTGQFGRRYDTDRSACAACPYADLCLRDSPARS